MNYSILLAAVLTMSSSLACADGYYVKLKAEAREGKNQTSDASTYGMTFGKNINSFLDAELYSRVKLLDNSDRNDTRVEGAVVGKYPVGIFSVYTRAAVGTKLTGTSDTHYWTIEPGIKYTVNDKLTVKTGYRWRTGFDEINNDDTRMLRVGADYALTKNSTIGVGYDRSSGDSDYNAIGASYGIKF